MDIPSEARSTRHSKAFTQYHLAALRADAGTAHRIRRRGGGVAAGVPSEPEMRRSRAPATLPAMADPSQLLQDALALPPRERAELAEAIMVSLDGFDLGDEWEEEIQRRVDEVDAGRVQPLPGEEVLSRLEQRFLAAFPE